METILLGGVIHPICSESFEEGYIILKNGRISDLGRLPWRRSYEEQGSIDCRESIFTHLIDAHTHLGILEEKQEKSVGNNETSVPLAPHPGQWTE